MDITLSNDDDTMHQPELDASADQKVPAGDDAEDDGATSAKPIAPNLIKFGVPEQSKPSATDQTLVVVPPAGGHG
jgi:hypothetical protein